MFVRYTSLAIILLLNLYFDTSYCIECQKTLENDKEKLDKCNGDVCVTNIVVSTPGGPGSPTVSTYTYGCLMGFEMKLGCFTDSWNNTVCVCNDNMCNANKDVNSGKAKKIEVECYNGPVINGEVAGNLTCKGQACQLYYADTVAGTPAEITAGCVIDMIPTFHSGKGCLLFPNTQGGNDTWQCRCQENLCNSPSTFPTPTRSGNVKCGSGFVNVNTSAPGPFQNNPNTCTGDFCVLTPMGNPPVIYSKGCISVSNGAKVETRRYKFDVGKTTDIYICNRDNCNDDVDTALGNHRGDVNENTTTEEKPIVVEHYVHETVVVEYNNSTVPANASAVEVHHIEATVEVISANGTTQIVEDHHMHMAGMSDEEHRKMMEGNGTTVIGVVGTTPAPAPVNATVIVDVRNGTATVRVTSQTHAPTPRQGATSWTISSLLIFTLSYIAIKL